MACLGVHFALNEMQERKILKAADDTDQLRKTNQNRLQ